MRPIGVPASTYHWSASSPSTMKGARSLKFASMRVVHRSGGSTTCESDEISGYAAIGVSPSAEERSLGRSLSRGPSELAVDITAE